jgi:long-subunit fatty acid transport protein
MDARARLHQLVGVVVFLLVLHNAATSALAQAGPTNLEFSFSNPGARSLGFGGAFVALADDATAAFANPAGLTQLARPEVSVEGRRWSYTTPFTLGGRINGTPTGHLLDSVEGLRFSESTTALSGLSFLSFVYPRENWSIAFYRHQSARFESISETQGFFGTSESGDDFRFRDLRGRTSIDFVSYGLAGAYRPVEGLSLGFGLVLNDGEFSSETDIYLPVPETLPQGLFGPNAYDPRGEQVTAGGIVDDTALAFSAGLLWQANRNWSIGAAYRRGPTFDIEIAEVTGKALEEMVPEGTVYRSDTASIHFPDVFSVGAAYRTQNGAWTLSFEWDHVRYSSIFDSVVSDLVDSDQVAVDDANELRAGFEYAFIQAVPLVALRAGVWLDPDHRIREVSQNLYNRAIFQGGEDELHLALGFGLAFSRFQFDVGADLSEFVDTLSVSGIVSF